MKILLTGAAGFIGMHAAVRLAAEGHQITAVDSINNYYDTQLKYDRLERLGFGRGQIVPGRLVKSCRLPELSFIQGRLEDETLVDRLFETQFDAVCHLAGQAGVRYALKAPLSYVSSNVQAFAVLIEAAAKNSVGHFVYASTSSVYGLNRQMPYSRQHGVDHPASLYAATKRANELFAHVYSHIYNLPTTGLRFFTVYGPWGRPDMALYLFTDAILNQKPIKLYNYGNMARDFTYIDDIVEGLARAISLPPESNATGAPINPAESSAPFSIYNLGRGAPVKLMDFVRLLEGLCGKAAIIESEPLQPGDIESTWADTADTAAAFGHWPAVNLATGLQRYYEWFCDYYLRRAKTSK